MPWSYQEKSAWISLCSTVLIFGYYFWRLFSEGATMDNKDAAMLAIQVVTMSVLVEAFFHGMLAATNRKAAEMGADERDALFGLKATRLGYSVLVVGCFIVIGRLVTLEVNPEFAFSGLQAPLLSAHLLLLSFVLSEVVRFAAQIVYYRRDA